jgi:hypothetical protein
MCDVDDEMGRAEIARAGYAKNCSVKPARDGVKSREGGGVRKPRRSTREPFGHTAPQLELQNTFSRLLSVVCVL